MLGGTLDAGCCPQSSLDHLGKVVRVRMQGGLTKHGVLGSNKGSSQHQYPYRIKYDDPEESDECVELPDSDIEVVQANDQTLTQTGVCELESLADQAGTAKTHRCFRRRSTILRPSKYNTHQSIRVRHNAQAACIKSPNQPAPVLRTKLHGPVYDCSGCSSRWCSKAQDQSKTTPFESSKAGCCRGARGDGMLHQPGPSYGSGRCGVDSQTACYYGVKKVKR